MTDQRIKKFADVLVQYSLELKSGQTFVINTNPLAELLALEVYRSALLAGANAYILLEHPQAWEVFYKVASDDQLQFLSPLAKFIVETFDARLSISAEQNTRTLSGVDPKRMAMRSQAWRPIMRTFMERASRRELRWCTTEFPTHASAQEADMSVLEYEEFIYSAGKLNDPDPIARWKEEGLRMERLVDWLHGKKNMVIRGADVDLKLSIEDRTFVSADGHENFPDGEIFTGPVEESVNGWICFHYPAIYAGREVVDVELWFENGKVVKEKASKGGEFLTSMLNTDQGARFLGELGIGTNYDIPRFTKNMLFDEKLGGTIHLAVGASYPETGARTTSGSIGICYVI